MACRALRYDGPEPGSPSFGEKAVATKMYADLSPAKPTQ